jgi:hypothetical protein
MPETMRRAPFIVVAALLAAATGAPAQTHHHGGSADAADARRLVDMPEPMRRQMLANMRDHLQALQEINAAPPAVSSTRRARSPSNGSA